MANFGDIYEIIDANNTVTSTRLHDNPSERKTFLPKGFRFFILDDPESGNRKPQVTDLYRIQKLAEVDGVVFPVPGEEYEVVYGNLQGKFRLVNE